MRFILSLLTIILGIQFSYAQIAIEALDAPDVGLVPPENANLEIQPVRYLVSVYDNDYLPMSANNLSSQPPQARIGAQSADGTNDPVLNYVGKIGKRPTKEERRQFGPFVLYADRVLPSKSLEHFTKKHWYPVVVTLNNVGKAPLILAEASIPAKYIKNSDQDEKVYIESLMVEHNQGEESVFYTRALRRGVQYMITADKDLELVQLDMNNGIGQDGKGILLTTFHLPEGWNQGQNNTLELRLLPAIPDRYANDTTHPNYAGHQTFHMPIIARDGRTWLNTDLGFIAGNLSFACFNPFTQFDYYKTDKWCKALFPIDGLGTPYKDEYLPRPNAFRFQYGRKADGHEGFVYVPNRSGDNVENTQEYTPTSDEQANSWYNAGTTHLINSDYSYYSEIMTNKSWVNPNIPIPDEDLWSVNGANNPCPVGYEVASISDYKNLQTKIIHETAIQLGNTSCVGKDIYGWVGTTDTQHFYNSYDETKYGYYYSGYDERKHLLFKKPHLVFDGGWLRNVKTTKNNIGTFIRFEYTHQRYNSICFDFKDGRPKNDAERFIHEIPYPLELRHLSAPKTVRCIKPN